MSLSCNSLVALPWRGRGLARSGGGGTCSIGLSAALAGLVNECVGVSPKAGGPGRQLPVEGGGGGGPKVAWHGGLQSLW